MITGIAGKCFFTAVGTEYLQRSATAAAEWIFSAYRMETGGAEIGKGTPAAAFWTESAVTGEQKSTVPAFFLVKGHD